MGKKFSELERAVTLNNGDLAAFAQVDQSAATGYKSKAAPMSLVSQKILKDTEYASDLQTDNKTVLGAINEAAMDKNIANPYSNQATYAIGDFVIYQTVLYKCITAVSVAEDFDSTKWTQAKVSDLVGAVTSNKMDKANPTGTGSLAVGDNVSASGTNSTALGKNATASGSWSFASGHTVTASASDAHAEGYLTKALAQNTHAEGFSTEASGNNAHAEGSSTNASGHMSHAEGFSSYATHKCQHVFGENNLQDGSSAPANSRGNFVEIVGNGADPLNRSNARTLGWDGHETIAGDLTFNAGTTPQHLTSELQNRYTKDQVDAIIDSILPTDEASGSIANFKTSLELPIKSLEADVNAVQSAGTPTPATPLPISGWSEIKIRRCGKNLVDIRPFNEWQTARVSYYVLRNSVPNKVINVSLIDKDTTVDLTGVSFGFVDSSWDTTEQLTASEYRWVIQGGTPQTIKRNTAIGNSNNVLTGLMISPQTEEAYNKIMARYYFEFEIDTATEYEAYNGKDVTIALGGTYYGGHFTQDKAGHRQFEVTHNYIASYNGEAINEPWISSMDTYSQGATPTTGAQVVYPLATPYTINLPDGEPIITLNGTNNIYADTGDTAVSFKCSVEDYVNAHSGSGNRSLGVSLSKGSGGNEPEEFEEKDLKELKDDDEESGEIEPISKR